MSDAAAGKTGASGVAVTAPQIVQGVDATKTIEVKSGGETRHRFVEGPYGRVPWYSQNPGDRPPGPVADWTWAQDLMHTKTIAEVGCGLTCAAMILSYFGYKVTPGGLNAYAKEQGVYVPGTNRIGEEGWDKLFRYGGATLTRDRGTVGNGRLLAFEDASHAAKRKAIFDRARALVGQGTPLIARVDYVGSSTGSHSGWGDHFVVVAGVHKDGHLLINDPGRFFRSLDVGDGAHFPDLRHNWLAEDPAKGTTKNGGYTLVRLDVIEGPSAPSSVASQPPAAPLTEGTWKEWATGEVERHATAFIPRLLATARTAILREIEARFASVTGDNPVEYVFDPRRIDLLVRAQAESLIANLHRELGDAVRRVVEEVKQHGFTPPVAIKVPSFLSQAVASAVEGVVKVTAEVVPSGPRFLDLAERAIPGADFAAALERAREALTSPDLPRVAFTLKRVTWDGRSMFGVSVGAGLLDHLAEQPEWLDLETEGEVTFVFPTITDLAQAILVKAFTAIGLIEDGAFAGSLAGLLSAEDGRRLGRVLDGDVRLEVKASASAFSPAPVLDALGASSAQGSASGKLVIEFHGNQAVLRIDARGTGQVGSEQATVEVDLRASGRLVLPGKGFKPVWDAPRGAFDELVAAFVETLDGDVEVSLRGRGAANAAASTAAFGLFRLHGGGDLALTIRYKDRRASLDFAGAGAGEIAYDGHNVELELRTGAGARFEVPAPHGFLTFWRDPRNGLDGLLGEIFGTLEAQARVEVSARTATSIGLFRLSPEAKLSLSWASGGRVTLEAAASCATTIDFDGHALALALGGEAGASFALAGAPSFGEFRRDPQGGFERIVERLLATLEVNASIAVTAQHAFATGLLQLRSNGAFTLDLAPPEAVFRFEGGSAARSINLNGRMVDLSLGGGAGLRLDLGGVNLRAFWQDPQGSFTQLLREAPMRLLGKATVQISADAGIPIGDAATLEVGGGLSLELERSRGALKSAGDSRLTLPQLALELAIGVDLDVDPDGEWEIPLAESSFASLWEDPEQGFPALIDTLFERFQGHARLLMVASGSAAGQVPLPGVLEKLRELRLRLTGGAEFVVDYWSRAGQRYVIVKYSAAASNGAVLSIDSTGVSRIEGRRLPALLRDPRAELGAIASALASETNVRLVYAGVTLRANVEKLYEAIQAFDQGRYLDGLVAIQGSTFVTLPGQEEESLGIVGAAVVAAYYTGWLS